MKSYASVDRIVGKFAVCELELQDILWGKDFVNKKNVMVDIPLEQIPEEIGEVQEGDILLINHVGGIVLNVCGKDDAEKNRRIEQLKAMMEKMKK